MNTLEEMIDAERAAYSDGNIEKSQLLKQAIDICHRYKYQAETKNKKLQLSLDDLQKILSSVDELMDSIVEDVEESEE